MLEAKELEAIKDFLVHVAQDAGDMIMSAHPTSGSSSSKKNVVDLVTETDKAVEESIGTKLRAKYPTFSFIGEESYSPGTRLGPEPTFIVDPIDGTTNFVHSHPYVCISLGLTVDRQPVVGVVYNPFTQTLYSAVKGQGAYMNSTTKLPLRSNPEPLTELNRCLIAIEWGSDRAGNDFQVKAETFKKLAQCSEEGGAMVQSFRSLGSAALNLCGVAAGHLDLYWEAGCWAWDVCAGWCILNEAGGMVVDANPGEWNPVIEQRRYLAVRGGEGQKKIIEDFWVCVQGRFTVGINSR